MWDIYDLEDDLLQTLDNYLQVEISLDDYIDSATCERDIQSTMDKHLSKVYIIDIETARKALAITRQKCVSVDNPELLSN